MALRPFVKEPEWFRTLGEQWSCCDNISLWPRLELVRILMAGRAHWPLMMDDHERARWSSLPAKVTVYRGCGPINRMGFSWSLNRETASRFPTLNRYKQTSPLLIEASIPRERIVALKLDREEEEAICLVQAKHIKAERPLSIARGIHEEAQP
jgi:hypothetical protein